MNNEHDDNVIDIDKTKVPFKLVKNLIITGIVLIFLLYIGFNSVFIVDSGEQAVVTRFGQFESVRSEGLNVIIPVIDQYTIVDVQRKHKMEYGFQTVQQGNEKQEAVYNSKLEEGTVIVNAADNNASIVLLELIIQYRIADPVQYLYKVDDVEGTLKLVLEASVRDAFQTFTFEDARTNKQAIDAVIKKDLQQTMRDYQSGIEITTVNIQNVELLPTVQEAYKQKENANQYMKGKLEEAEKYENTVIPQAEAEAEKMMQDAEAHRANVIAEANAAVAEFDALYNEYINNPEIVKEKYYLEAMEAVINNNDIVINNTQAGDLNIFYNVDDQKEKVVNEIN
ncbi:FtsH protease activity modulator HflK [Vallitalea okinawensis]|uniref:FtsH protease activity modulator HflK n=1 Tax=Vallitalea okinawensis TaxID=2078660 RepID=UPI000CFC15B3|nr:FtsH protease activity modulator HflK [Vallitalea okinawensis]